MPGGIEWGHGSRMSWWSVPDVTGWRPVQDEPRGLRPKRWVEDDTGTGQRWLRKEHRASRPYEPAIEALTLEVARRCGFDVAHGRACLWDQGGAQKRGFVSRHFHDDSETQHTGSELVAAVLDAPYETASEKTAARALVTIDVVRAAIERQAERLGADLMTPFVRMLAFDAWIGNGDRHAGNWAILVGRARGRLAPMYDTAACLGAELQDAAVTRLSDRDALGAYVRGCRSGFGDGGTMPGIFQRDLIDQLRSWPQWSEVAPPLFAFVDANFAMVDQILAEIPDEWLPERRKHLARALLKARVKMLRELPP